jgi:SAM-dependent methyltransferase
MDSRISSEPGACAWTWGGRYHGQFAGDLMRRNIVIRLADKLLGRPNPLVLKPWRKNWQHDYERQLSDAEIRDKEHRDFVGGLWEEIGTLQFEFVRQRGLSPSDRFLDVGCGALRGGIHFIRYLEPGNYFGIDMNPTLIKAAREIELVEAGLADRAPHLLVNESFEFQRFGTTFPFALALSVFTHLGLNTIQRCLVNMAEVLEPGGRFFATYFPSDRLHRLEKRHHPGGVVSKSDADPFHYHFSVFQFLTTDLPLAVRDLGDWSHPRNQYMLEFTKI